MNDNQQNQKEKELRWALVNYLGERSESNLFNFFDLLRQGKVLSPAQVEGMTDEQTQELVKSGQVKIQGRLRIKNSCLMVNGKKYLPIFTCRVELEKGPKCNSILVPPSHFRQVLNNDPEITALLVDPFSKPNLVIPREKLDDILEGRYRDRDQVREMRLDVNTRVIQPEPFPTELAGSLYVLLDNLEGVERAWLLQIDDPARKGWLVVADYHDIRRDTLTAMLCSAAKKHGQGLPMALLPLEGAHAERLVRDKEPFFVSGDRDGSRGLLN